MRSLKSLLLREEHVCPWWLAYTFDNPLRRFLHDPAALLGPHVREGMAVLDIGCGMGHFSLGLAALVGEAGTVVAADLQQEMLDITRRRAERAGLAQRIRFVRSAADDISVPGPVDFALAFWMAHEVPDAARFFGQVRAVLREEGRLLVAEPKLHVDARKFRDEVRAARDAGFRELDEPAVRFSRAVLLGRG